MLNYKALCGLILVGLLATKSQAQPPQVEVPARPAFAVTSVKPTDLTLRQQIDMRVLPDGTLTATNVTLKFLIRVAYNVQDVQISGGPNWLNSDKYDILAKPEESTKVQLLPMLRALLEDRFKLVVRHEVKEVPVYELRLAKPGGKLGPNLHQLEAGECPPGPSQRTSPPTPPCSGFLAARNQLTGHRVPLSALAANLSNMVERPVLDKTGRTEQFDLELFWTPDVGGAGPGDTIPIPADVSAPTLFTALQEQLGLKLESSRRPVDMLVLDRVEKPSPN